MNDSKKLLMLLGIMNNMSSNSYQDQMITFDPDINDCLIYMYVYMMSGEGKYYLEFSQRYVKLNDYQREFVKNDYINIINAQDENEKKIKRKGEIKYE
ncbi:MAG: hypothetical protein IKN63_04725 [Bacilli bacterium]|nr:hypothetical protein [Bacilli bacterium]